VPASLNESGGSNIAFILLLLAVVHCLCGEKRKMPMLHITLACDENHKDINHLVGLCAAMARLLQALDNLVK
jgi:hypothetical protein